ncbi:MAG: VWA domain-containing protein [Sandaracinaceae bacterium]|nr:VWA domain-containing protein [Sandaracinaceae bacterium]
MSKRVARFWNKGGVGIAIAALALAVGGVVLLEAPGHAVPSPGGGGGPFAGADDARPIAPASGTRASLSGPSLDGHFALAEGAVLAAGTRRVLAELRFNASTDARPSDARQPVALALVMDISGSMSGDKIVQARTAVQQMIERMHGDDHVAVILYDHEVQVLQPLARVGAVRRELVSRLSYVDARGGTVIPPALEAGAQALEQAPPHLVRRVVLLSDGQDGSGVPLPVLAENLRGRAGRGIAASALGIGADYDERFMTTVADAGRGNYAFMAGGAPLAAFLRRELDEAAQTVVDGLAATVTLPSGWRLRHAHGAEADGRAGTITLAFGPLAAGDTRRAVLDLEVDAGAPGELGALAASARYRTVADRRDHRVESDRIAVRAVATEAEIAASRDESIYGETWATVVDAAQAEAVEAWRRGDVTTARQISQGNAQQLRAVAAAAPAAAPRMTSQIAELETDQRNFDLLAPTSEAGRAYGLGSNAARHARARR